MINYVIIVQRTEAIEHSSVLRTKAMREKDELKAAIKYYRFILLRIRFPEDVILQGLIATYTRSVDSYEVIPLVCV